MSCAESTNPLTLLICPKSFTVKWNFMWNTIENTIFNNLLERQYFALKLYYTYTYTVGDVTF